MVLGVAIFRASIRHGVACDLYSEPERNQYPGVADYATRVCVHYLHDDSKHNLAIGARFSRTGICTLASSQIRSKEIYPTPSANRKVAEYFEGIELWRDRFFHI